jgi:hypothetical protein
LDIHERGIKVRRFHLVSQIIQAERFEVFLRGRDVFVAEKRLQCFDVDAGLKHLRGECMPLLVQVELLAVWPVAAPSLLCIAPFAIQFGPVCNLFTQLEPVCVGLVTAIVFPFRVWRSREDQRCSLVLLPSRT